MFDYGFSCVQQIDLADYLPEISLPVVGGVLDSVGAQLSGDTVTAVLQGEERKITAQVYIEPFYYAPILPEQKLEKCSFIWVSKDWIAGIVSQTCSGRKIAEKESFWDQVKSWFGQ